MTKGILLVFFCGLGIYSVARDILNLIDESLVLPKADGYFTVLAFMVIYFGIRYFRKRGNNGDKSKGLIVKM